MGCRKRPTESNTDTTLGHPGCPQHGGGAPGPGRVWVRSAHTLPAVVCVCVCIEKCACESCSDSLQDVPKILILASLITRLRDLLWPQV